MLSNATLIRVDRRAGADATGNEILAVGNAVSVRCLSDQAKSDQKWNLGATTKDATKELYVAQDAWTGGGLTAAPVLGDRVMVTTDDGDTYTMQTIQVAEFSLCNLSHWVLFLKPN